MEQILAAVFLGFAGNSLISLGQVIQKSQVQGFDIHEGGARKARHIGLWIAGIAGSNIGLAILYWAISIGSASIAGAMNGTGLASLILFSRLILGERIDRWEAAGIALIMLGVVVFPLAPMPVIGQPAVEIAHLWIGAGIMTGVIGVLLAATIVMKKPAGMALGFLAGTFTGFSALFQRAGASEFSAGGGQGVIYTIVWLGFFLLSFLTLQFAYRENPILKILPYFTGFKALIPLIGGVLFFSERLSALQWSGAGLILAGVVVIGVRMGVNGKRERNTIHH
ncbi:MAG: DMT family transporter [Brevinematales bacterium]|nr:DMT family transporter [Brevinematales bacterium]